MVAYLEKTDGNTGFHQIMDFLTSSLIYYALTVSPIVSTSFVEQFWMTAKSRTVNNISYIDVIVAGKPVTISEASIRSDLLFDDADGIDSLNNQAIFDNIHSKQYKRWKVTPLFDSVLVQQTKDKGEASEQPSASQPIPSPPYPSTDQHETQPDPSPRPLPTFLDSIPEGSSGNHGGQSSSDRSLSGNEDGMTLQRESQTCYLTSQSLDEEYLYEAKIGRKEIIEEKLDAKGVYEGRTSYVVLEEKENADKEVSIEAPFNTVKPNKGTDKRNEGTNKQDGGSDSTKVSTDRQGKGTANQNEGKSATQTALTTTSTPSPTTATLTTPTPTIFGDDETIAQVLIIMSQNKEKLKEKEKGVELKDVDEIDRVVLRTYKKYNYNTT
ncbi:hypothetical protein Tco_0344319 [Tanacetum coccineum]